MATVRAGVLSFESWIDHGAAGPDVGRGKLSVRRPTINDVAALSGVGRGSVSRVLNDGPNVSARLRQRVLKAVEDLGYQVNVQARSLAGGMARLLTLICASDINSEPNSYYQSALEVGALRACAGLGFHLATHMVTQGSGDHIDEICALIEESRPIATVLTPPFSDDRALLDRIEKITRVVCISPGPQMKDVVYGVAMDDEAAGFAVTEALIALGHRRFGFIQGLERHVSAEGRYRGALNALAAHGLGPEQMVARRGNFTFRAGRDLLPELLEAPLRPTAIICGNDDTAVGALFAAHQIGLRVPADLSIASFDDTPVSALVWPPLTTIRQPLQEMAQRAVELVAERLKANGFAMPPPTIEYLPFTLIERGTTAPPPADAH